MITEIFGSNAPEAYTDGLWKLAICGVEGESRNGRVITIPGPTTLEIVNPMERVLFHPTRDANPYFHLMEFVWMMAGSNDAEWISQFNKRMMEYADDNILRGAYGWRWANPSPQVSDAIALLQESPGTRQAVLSMWDPTYDGPSARTSDRPCNTHIYLRGDRGRLDMTVCNRSNDFLWGMLGSNVVHMTMLHELIARATGLPLGFYRVFTNNLHVYPDMPRFEEIWNDRTDYDYYDRVSPLPILQENETYEEFVGDAKQMVEHGLPFSYRTEWFRTVAEPMHEAYLYPEMREELNSTIAAQDWRLVCQEWCARRAAVV